ncbi:hypothetical protein CQW23_02424 [Capsicum baccatum]|uniref:Ubiquitin-like protease family profile domain-containing protein n=1 Tax=Capsicum baccatum TaxID=33114 RepID=A0A2G2XRS6_CAPBA|nr:hypothetical protein CQW23_02424 [Capsicum baccatum]
MCSASTVVRCVMTLEVKGSSSSGIVICANDTYFNFISGEFAIVTGLNCLSNRFRCSVLGSTVILRARCSTSSVVSKPESPIEEVAMLNSESHVEKEVFISKKFFDALREEVRQEFKGIHKLVKKKFNQMLKAIEQSKKEHEDNDPEVQQMDYDGAETSPQRFSPTVDQNLGENQDGTKQIDVCFFYLRKKSKYDPNKSYKFSTVDCNFMNIIRFVHDVYSVDDPNLSAGGQEAHLNEYISGFRMHTVVPWHTVEDIYISINIKEKHHWVLEILSFSERCIFLYYSYESSGHFLVVLAQIKKLAEIIPLYLETCDFYNKKGIDFQNHPRYKDKDCSNLFDVIFEENLPQQPSGSLDCGLFMVTYADCLSYGHKVIATEFDPSALCTKYVVLLWDYGIRKQEANAHSDVEAPLRPARQSRITSVTKVFDV